MRWNEIFELTLAVHNSGNVQWKNFVPVSYCRATQELENGGWIMESVEANQKRTTFDARHFSLHSLYHYIIYDWTLHVTTRARTPRAASASMLELQQ